MVAIFSAPALLTVVVEQKEAKQITSFHEFVHSSSSSSFIFQSLAYLLRVVRLNKSATATHKYLLATTLEKSVLKHLYTSNKIKVNDVEAKLNEKRKTQNTKLAPEGEENQQITTPTRTSVVLVPKRANTIVADFPRILRTVLIENI